MEKNLGHATAYGYAKSKGYTGTEEEFGVLMASYASVAQDASQSASSAAESAQLASNEAQKASQSATSAHNDAETASNIKTDVESARDTTVSAKNATVEAKDISVEAKNSAISAKDTAENKAQIAEAWAVGQKDGTDVPSTDETYHNNAKYYSEQADIAKTDAETARDAAAQSASEAAESARTLTIDPTLMQSGQAADAKAVGDEIDGLKSDLNDKVSVDGVAEVTPQNLQIVDADISPNLLDETKIINGKYILANGTEGEGDYKVTDYIPVEENEPYWFTWKYQGNQVGASLRFLACYDESKVVIPSAGSNNMITEYPLTIAEGVKYVRLSFSSNARYSQFQFEKGENYSEYSEYGQLLYAVIKSQYLPDEPFDMKDVPAFELVKGQNLWNSAEAVKGFLTIAGAVSGTTYTTSGFIPVSDGERLVGSYSKGTGMGPAMMRTVACYDSDKNVITASGVYSADSFVVPAGVSYVRICFADSYGLNLQVQNLPSDEAYYPYKEHEEPHYELKHDYMFGLPEKPVNVYLPSDIYVAVGRTIELYNEQVCLDHEKYHFRWVCAEGSAYKRKFTITGKTARNLNLRLYLYDDKKRICWTGMSIIHVVAASNPVKKILPIGDSLTNWKAWLQETMLLSGNNITFVGTRYSGQSVDSAGNIYPSGQIHSEGRSGWGADAYLSNETYTFDNRYDGVSSVVGTANPFWDGSKFSLNHYLTTQTGVETPDAVQIFLGTNDVGSGVDVAVSNISSLVTSIRGEYPDIPIFVCNTIYRSNQNGYGSVGSDAYSGNSVASAWQYDEDSKIMNLAKGLRDALAGVTGVYFIPLLSCMDREYGFGAVQTAVNPRSDITIPMPAESVHPVASGYYQMADLMYSTYCGVLS